MRAAARGSPATRRPGGHMDLTRRAVLTIGLLLGLCSGARADLYDDYVNSASKKPFVAFLARKSPHSAGKPGHSFVGIGVEVDNGELIYLRLYGYYPNSSDVLTEVKALFSKVSGDIHEDIQDVSWTVQYRVDVDDAVLAKAQAVFDSWKSADPKYNLLALGGKNCSSLVAETAAAIGLKVPSGAGSTFPVNYVQALKDLKRPALSDSRLRQVLARFLPECAVFSPHWLDSSSSVEQNACVIGLWMLRAHRPRKSLPLVQPTRSPGGGLAAFAHPRRVPAGSIRDRRQPRDQPSRTARGSRQHDRPRLQRESRRRWRRRTHRQAGPRWRSGLVQETGQRHGSRVRHPRGSIGRRGATRMNLPCR